MAEWGALAQALPAAATLTNIFTCPADERATVTIVVCNRAGAAVVRLEHAKAGATSSSAQSLMFDYPLAANDAVNTTRFVLNAGDIIRARSDTGSVAFNVNGITETAS